jgi:hypothetical protein
MQGHTQCKTGAGKAAGSQNHVSPEHSQQLPKLDDAAASRTGLRCRACGCAPRCFRMASPPYGPPRTRRVAAQSPPLAVGGQQSVQPARRALWLGGGGRTHRGRLHPLTYNPLRL